MPVKPLRLRDDSNDYFDSPLLLNHLVVESAVHPHFTGVFDADGNPLYRFPNPIGFGRDNEW